MNLIGHKDILTFFEKASAAEKLHHAYLFVGRAQLGKRTVAEYIARQQFGDQDASLVSNPDFFFLQRGSDAKTGKTKKNISIEQVHELRHFLQGKPFLHKKKIAVIDDAELLSTGAMNALLKTLEEPRGDAMIFLIATNETALLETIRSRCQTLYFHPVQSAEIEAYMQLQDIDSTLAASIALHAAGLPGRAISWMEDPEQHEWYMQEAARCKKLLGAPLHAQLTLVEDLFAKKDDHIATRATLVTILDIWQQVFRNAYTAPDSARAQRYDIVRTYDAIERAKKGLSQNVHPRMLIERILLTLS